MERKLFIDWQKTVRTAIEIRKSLKLSQEECAVLAGVSKPTLNDFEQGRTTITVASLLKILKTLGMTDD